MSCHIISYTITSYLLALLLLLLVIVIVDIISISILLYYTILYNNPDQVQPYSDLDDLLDSFRMQGPVAWARSPTPASVDVGAEGILTIIMITIVVIIIVSIIDYCYYDYGLEGLCEG